MGDTAQKRVVSTLVLTLIIDLLAFTCILPLFPSILSYYAKNNNNDILYETLTSALNSFQTAIGAPINERYNYVFFGGVLGSLFCYLQFLSSPTLGALSDVYGRKPMLLLSCLGSLLSYVLWLNASTFTIFFISRIIGGLSKTNTNVATAMMGDIYRGDQNPKGMALIGISYSVGFLVGPMIGAYFSVMAKQEAFFTLPAKFAIVLTIIQFIIISRLPETADFKTTKSRSSVSQKAYTLLSPQSLFKFDAVQSTIEKKNEMEKYGIVYFLYLFLYSGLEFTLPFLTHIRFNYNSIDQGKIYLFTGLLMLFIQGGISRRIPIERQQKLAQIGMFLSIPAFLVIAIATSVTVFSIGLFFFAIASATVVPALTSCLTNINTDDSERGALVGVFRSIGSLARAIGPIIASSVFWLAGPTTCYLIGGISLTIPLYLLKSCLVPAKRKE